MHRAVLRVQLCRVHGGVGEGAREQRGEARLAFEKDRAAFGFGARDEIGEDAGEHHLVADALFAADEQARALQRGAVPAFEAMIRHRHLAGHVEAGGIILPAVLQIAGEQMKDGAVEFGLCILRLLGDGAGVEILRGLVIAGVGQHVGEVAERGGIVGAQREGFAVMLLGTRCIAQLAPGRAERQPQFRCLCRMRFEQGDGGAEIAARAQQIGEIDEGFEPRRLLRQHAAVEFLGGTRQPKRAGGVAEGEEDARAFRLHRQRLFEAADGIVMAAGRGEAQAIFISAGAGKSGHADLSPARH